MHIILYFTYLANGGPGYVGGDQFFGEHSRILRSVLLTEVNQLLVS